MTGNLAIWNMNSQSEHYFFVLRIIYNLYVQLDDSDK